LEAQNKTIAKNTLFLYFRLIFKLLISLITSRIILDALGFNDFGLYNVVGGAVSMFAFLNHSMAAATQRFLNFEMGKGEKQQLKTVFSTSLFLHILIAIIILILAETIGLWFVNNKLQIAPDRMYAANWVFQLSAITLFVQILSLPFQASMIAHEKMSAFAYISIFEALLILLIAIGLDWTKSDKLIFYATLLFALAALISIIYMLYGLKKFEECKLKIKYDKTYFSEMLTYSGWNTISVFSVMLKQQGVDILLNLFFGTVVNAARALAVRINNVVSGFVSNFMQAMNPQIVKNYAKGELTEMKKLIFFGSKFSFFLILFFALPILIETEAILALWLKEVPEFTSVFTRLVLLTALIDSLNNTLLTGQSATGNIKRYHITLSSIGLLNLPISYVLLKYGGSPYIPLVITLIQSGINTSIRLSFLKKSIHLEVKEFINDVILRALIITIVASILPIVAHIYLNPNLITLLFVCGLASISVAVSFFLIGLRNYERQKVIQLLSGKIPFLKRFVKPN
jgi:O-antigen/teichoic acid export membrane protein